MCVFFSFHFFPFFFPVDSQKQLNRHIQSQKRVMTLTVLRMTGQHGKMTPEEGSEELDFGVSKEMWIV